MMYEETHSSPKLYQLIHIIVFQVNLILKLFILLSIIKESLCYNKQTFLPFII